MVNWNDNSHSLLTTFSVRGFPMDLIERLIMSNQRIILDRICHLVGPACFKQCRLVCRLWATHAFTMDFISRQKLRRAYLAVERPHEQFRTSLKFDGVVMDAKVFANYIYVWVEKVSLVVLLKVDAHTWQHNVVAMRNKEEAQWASIINGSWRLHKNTSPHYSTLFRMSRYCIASVDWRKFLCAPECSVRSFCTGRLNSALDSTWGASFRMLLETNMGDMDTFSSEEIFTHAYVTDQHLLAVSTNEDLIVRDIYTMSVVCSAKMPPVLLQHRSPDDVQFRSDDVGLMALLLWRSGEKLWMWNMTQKGAPRCFRSVAGELIFNTSIIVHQTVEATVRTFRLSDDVNVYPEESSSETVMHNLHEFFEQNRDMWPAAKTVCLDDRLSVAIGVQKDILLVSEVGPFLSSTCPNEYHDRCPGARREATTKHHRIKNGICHSLTVRQIANVRCNTRQINNDEAE